MDTTVKESMEEQSPTDPLNLVSIDEIISTETATEQHPDTPESVLDMSTIVERLEDPRSATVLGSIAT